jgi:hypothetical protein
LSNSLVTLRPCGLFDASQSFKALLLPLVLFQREEREEEEETSD